MNNSSRTQRIGYMLVFAGVALFATIEVAVRDSQERLAGHSVPPMLLTALRFFIPGIIFLALALFRSSKRRVIPETRDFFKIIILGLIGIPVGIGLFQFALTFDAMKASTSAAIFSINPIFVAVLAPLILKERIGIKEWFGLVLGFSGAVVMSCSFSDIQVERKELFSAGASMLAAAFFFAFYIVMSKPWIKKYGAFVYTGWAFLFGGSAAVILSICIDGIPDPELLHVSRGTLDIAWVVLGGTALGYYCYLVGLSKVNIAKGSYLFFAKPFLAFIFSLIYLDEGLFKNNEWVGFSLIVVGLTLVMFIPDRLFKKREISNGQ
ncbi:DMT family transporter [Planctomycetota bacterium]